MRSVFFVALLVGLAAANAIARPQEPKAVDPLSTTVLHGWLCHTCHEIVTDGINIGAAYNMAWLDSAIDMRCKDLAVISHSCKKHFHNDQNTIDQKIRAAEIAGYTCVDIGYCA